MKIAIVASSPIPFNPGGAENLWWGLSDAINRNTNHQCELIKVPIKESDFTELLQAYAIFSELDLSHFDLVISGKYPAWMVQHHNHHVYMLHCLRGLYDTFPFNTCVTSDIPEVKQLLRDLDEDKFAPLDLISLLESWKSESLLPESFWSFPGAFTRCIVRYLDRWAMKRVRSISCISNTVAQRDYFPDGAQVNTIYPPTHLKNLNAHEYDYFFSASRLDKPKRIDLIISAFKLTKTNKRLVVAGDGPEMMHLRKLAKEDPRIQLIGHVSEKELVEHYARCCAVVFVPENEDYGLITIEAMQSKKPVVTVDDAGGVTEFVENGITGLCSEPEVMALAANIDLLAFDATACKRMGEAAAKRTIDITWPQTVENLLLTFQKAKKNKIVVVSSYPIYPPRGGGQNRIYYLYKELSRDFSVEVISLVNIDVIGNGRKIHRTVLGMDFHETKVEKPFKYQEKERKMSTAAGIPVDDFSFMYNAAECQPLVEILVSMCVDASAVIASHPFVFPILKQHIKKPLIHESHNVEYLLKQHMLPTSDYNESLLEKLYNVERAACLESAFTTVCAFDDADTLSELYQLEKTKVVTVANGFDLNTVPFISPLQRVLQKEKLGFQDVKNVLFIGSWHQPNIIATQFIIGLASTLPEYQFVVLGSVSGYFDQLDIALPNNFAFAGVVSDEVKQTYFSIADIAINPMETGSGTNLKMLDYMASGIPVVSTDVGARGLEIPPGFVVIKKLEDFGDGIKQVLSSVDVTKARDFVEEHYAWSVIAKPYGQALRKIINRSRE